MIGRLFRRRADYLAAITRVSHLWGGESLSPYGVRFDLSHLGAAHVWD